MAINDDDKKFIKSTIEDALAAHDKQTESKQKLNDLKYREREKKDRQEYLAELKKREEQGQATMSEKFEMLKLSIDNAIPQDFKDAAKAGAKTASSGLNQMGKGVGHLTERLMMTNPITAFMWSNRDILKAVGDIGMGGLKIGGGIAKGVAGGIGGLFNQVINKKKQGNNEPEQEESKPLTTQPEAGGVAQLLQTKQDWQQQIQDIHNAMFKLRDNKAEKEAKNTNNILSQGLGGLGKSMKAVQGFVDLVAQKQKLILAGVLLGAVAIVGLAAWFKSGGLQKLLKDAVNDKISEMAPNLNAQSKVQAEDNLDAQIGQLKTNAEDMQNAQVSKIEGLYDKGGKEKAWKKQVASTAKSANLQSVLTTSNNGIAYTTSTVGGKKQGKTGDFRVPVACTLFECGLEGYGKDATWWIKLIREFEDKDKDRGWSRAPVIVVDNIKEVHVKTGEKVQANKKIATVNYPYHIYGDYDSFIKRDGKSYQDAMFTEEAMQGMAKQYNETQDSVYKNVGGIDHHVDKALDTKAGNRKEADINYIKNRINGGKRFEGMNEDKMFLKPSDTQGNSQNNTPPNASVSEVNQNSQKAQQQQQELNKKPEAKKQETNKKADVGSKQNVTIAQATPSTPMQFSDINLSNGVYNAATKNTVNLNGVNC